MAIGLRLLTAPEPLFTAAEARDLARLAGDQSDASVNELVAQATAFIEKRLSRSLLRTKWRQVWDAFPSNGGAMRVYRAPVLDEGLIEYIDPTSADWEEFEEVYWSIDQEPATIVPAIGESWPSVAVLPGAVRAEFYAGYGTSNSDVPAQLRRAVLTVASHWYEHPEALVTGTIATELAVNLEDILGQFEYCWEAH